MSRPARALTTLPELLREQRYRRQFLDGDRKQTALVSTVVTLATTATLRNDFLLLGDRPWLLRANVASRLLALAATLVSLVLLRRASWPRQHDRAAVIALAMTALCISQSNLSRLPYGEIQGPAFGTIAVICVYYFAHRSPLWQRFAACIVMSATVLAVLWNPRGEGTMVGRFTGPIAVIGLNVVGVYAARAFDEQRRARFEAERRERRGRKELAARLRELAVEKERAESASRARAAFLAAMSHEFRTPMNAVIGLSDVLAHAPLAPEHRAHARTIQDSARALLSQLNDILDFAKIDAQKLTLSPAPFDLRRLTASVADMFRPQAAARSIALTVSLSPGVPEHVVGDDARLRQVLVNLVGNALKFTERGAVTLRVAARALGGGDHEISFSVEDTGIGMAPGVLARLFRPFEQADQGTARRHGGTGLGLTISKEIVLAMGGDLRVVSEPGEGSTFSFALRLAEAPPPQIARPERRGDRPALAILVVDDQPINREVASFALERLGYAADLSASGEEGVLAASKKDYDVVLMDLQMPGMSGIDATAKIMAMPSRRPPQVVAMTAAVYEEDREACRRAGMRDFLGKPIESAHLSAVLERVAEERGKSAAAPAQVVLEAAAVDRLRRIQRADDGALLAKIGGMFVEDTRARLPRMRDALARGDVEAVAREAHILFSAAATVGASRMSALAAEVEEATRLGSSEGVAGRLAELGEDLPAVERALAEEIERERPGGP